MRFAGRRHHYRRAGRRHDEARRELHCAQRHDDPEARERAQARQVPARLRRVPARCALGQEHRDVVGRHPHPLRHPAVDRRRRPHDRRRV